MQSTSIPLRMQKVWAVSAGGAYIRTVPVNSQIGVTDGAASFETGFVPDNFTPVAGGGVPPFGQDFNGALNAVTAWLQWQQAGGPITYDSTFAAAIGGYPFGAILVSNVTIGVQWLSAVDNNLTNPDDPLTSSGWSRVGLPAGTPIPLLTAATPGGFILANGLTMGAVGSGANSPSNGLLFVYKAVWDQFSNTTCPILDSSGNPTTRGANAVADFAALKRLTTPNMKGLGVIGVDTMGGSVSTFLSGVPVTNGNTTTPGSILGENLHTLLTAEMPTHSHGVTDPTHNHNYSTVNQTEQKPASGGTAAYISTQTLATTSSATNISIQNAGGGGSHNTVERNMAVSWGLKV